MNAPGKLKRADVATSASSTGASAAAPIPTPSVDPSFAAGKKGPVGTSPRTNYSRVNTGAPPQMDAGGEAQKSLPPRGAEMLPKRASVVGGEGLMGMGKVAGRPMLQDLVKAAVMDSADRVRVSEEARQQSEKTASAAPAVATTEKVASEYIDKLANACEFLAGEFRKEAEHLQESPPGVSQATASKPLPDHKGQGVNTVPMHPGTQKDLKAEHGQTQMENTQDHAPQLHKQQIQTNYGKKTASPVALIRAKLAADEHEKKETEGLAEAEKGLAKAEKAHESEPENKDEKKASDPVSQLLLRTKQAEDAINPAQISAGAAVAPDTSAAGEAGGAPVGGAPQGPTGLVGSMESARDYTRGEAYANRKTDLKQYFNEPAMSAEHDKTLAVAFEHTSKAGPKIASANAAETSTKTAAARVLLSRLADNAAKQGTV